MRKLWICCVLAAASMVASAQLYPSRLGLMGAVVFHLGEKRVQVELHLNQDQTAKVADILSDHAKGQAAINDELRNAKPDRYAALQAKLDALESKTAKALSGTLDGSQQARAMQLALQEAGPFALRNASVAAKVGLSPAQRTSIEALAKATVSAMDEVNAKMGAELEAAPKGNKGNAARTKIVSAYDAKLKTLEKSGEQKVVKLLSGPQLQKWKAALGKPFKL